MHYIRNKERYDWPWNWPDEPQVLERICNIVAKKKNPWEEDGPGFPRIMFEWTTCPTCYSITTLRQCWGCLKYFCYDCLQEHMIGCKAWQDLKKSKE